VFADEPNYAQHLLGSRYGSVTMVSSGSDLMDLYLMSLCQHFIIANSTFSWWPAYFAEGKGGVIICPQNWVTIPGVRSPCPARWVHVPGAVLPLAVDDRQAAVAYRVIQKALFDSAIRDWFANRGDDTLRLNFGNLGRESVVVDLGGYEGDWSQKIHKRYGSTIHIFEPLSAFADKIAERFALVENVKVHRCGLGRRDEQVRFALAADGSGAFTLGGATTELVEIREWAAFLAAQNVDVIDVLKINIEGAEFELLEHILDSGLVDRIRVLQVQFHDVVPNAVARREAIRSKLARTHRCTWCYYFVWEEWQLH